MMVNRADLKTIVFGTESDTLFTDIGGKKHCPCEKILKHITAEIISSENSSHIFFSFGTNSWLLSAWAGWPQQVLA